MLFFSTRNNQEHQQCLEEIDFFVWLWAHNYKTNATTAWVIVNCHRGKKFVELCWIITTPDVCIHSIHIWRAKKGASKECRPQKQDIGRKTVPGCFLYHFWRLDIIDIVHAIRQPMISPTLWQNELLPFKQNVEKTFEYGNHAHAWKP